MFSGVMLSDKYDETKINIIVAALGFNINNILKRLYGRKAGHPRCCTTNQINK